MRLTLDPIVYRIPEVASTEWIAIRLSSLRKKEGISQRELSKRAGVDRAIISRTEDGSQDPSLGTIRRLAAYFDMSVGQFLSDPDAE